MELTTDTKPEIKKQSDSLLADYDLLSYFFFYPEDNSYNEKIKSIYNHLAAVIPESAEVMKPYIEYLSNSTLQEVQELFLRSFDVQAITTLDIGFILFGEDYKRGQLLVHLNREHREAGNICYTELSDHLPNVMRLLSKMKNEELRNEIALRLVMPAIEKMIGEFDNKKIEKKDEIYKKNLKTIIEFSSNYRTIFQTLLQSALIALQKDFGYEYTASQFEDAADILKSGNNVSGACQTPHSESGDFSKNIETEMNIEKY